LLEEITENWIPYGCQLWTASHSLGFIEYARDYEKGVIIDLDNLDFDCPQVLVPEKDNSLAVYEIAVPKETIFKIFQDKKLILCENQNDEYYNKLSLDNKLFIGQKDKETVISQIKNQPSFFGLIDKDYLTDNEIEKIKDLQKNLFILKYYSFENYLYHPDNLQELSDNDILKDWNKIEYTQNLINKKNQNLIHIGESLTGRKSYSLLKLQQLEKNRDKEKGDIISLLKSDKFEEFYPHFDIKKYGTPNLNLTKEQLVSTEWFKEKISQILKQTNP
jgi:hypothetical protein